ncbi:DUF3574 domain-containing protein [Vibrio rhodolitus]|uniref:DUF3574 domain-containing protein n=1 Tax=Vibrio rhodolitus TaxID=2231649 RepID=UPI000E0C352F|nr:DUF3574 domain-containing protein [Vibrio rhodolitus]
MKKLGHKLVLLLVILLSPALLASEFDYRAELFFGLSIPSGGDVTNQQWQDFVDQQIVPKFQGFNILDSMGYWQGEQENAKIVTILLTETQIPLAREIAQIYAKQFEQDSVMLVLSSVTKTEFIQAK